MSDINSRYWRHLARARCARATEGPWRMVEGKDGRLHVVGPDGDNVLRFSPIGPYWFIEDSQFVAAARTDLPRALDALDASEAAIDALRLQLAEVEDRASTVFCAYCSFEQHGPASVGGLQQHITICPHHPMRALDAEIERLRGALWQISKGEGEFSTDPLEHCTNTVQSMKALARTVLEQTP